MTLIYKYIVAFLMYTMTPGSSTVFKKKLFDYEMGGQRYLQEVLKQKPKSKKGSQYVKQLLQMSSVMDMLRYFNRM